MIVARGHHIRKQIGAFPVGLLVVKGLVVGQWRRQIQHMDGGCHIGVSQADQLDPVPARGAVD